MYNNEMQNHFNGRVLMSGAQFMTNASPINVYMHDEPFDQAKAIAQHESIKHALQAAGVEVVSIAPPADCQDGIFTANWALIRGKKALLANLPTVRKPETVYGKQVLKDLGFEVVELPEDIHFSGQGDTLSCGDYVFAGKGYRTDVAAHQYVHDVLGYEVVAVQAVPALDANNQPIINKATGWPDGEFYDIDLAISILVPPTEGKKGLIAWCPEALVPESQALMRSLDFVEKIEVSLEEALNVSACNLVSTGSHVVMNANAPQLKAAIEAHGLTVTALENPELLKNGGSVRCTTLTLDNE
jgi:N-dimethylarginine dimethylaminohydrolase